MRTEVGRAMRLRVRAGKRGDARTLTRGLGMEQVLKERRHKGLLLLSSFQYIFNQQMPHEVADVFGGCLLLFVTFFVIIFNWSRMTRHQKYAEMGEVLREEVAHSFLPLKVRSDRELIAILVFVFEDNRVHLDLYVQGANQIVELFE